MSEYLHVEKRLLDQLATLGWTVIDHGQGVPGDPAISLRTHFREWLLPDVFRNSVRAINRTGDGRTWLTNKQLDDLRDQILRQPNRSLLEANEAVQALLFKAQVDVNEMTGEPDPVARQIDFAHPERNTFHAINQFRIDTPGCVKQFIIPDIVLFVNGIRREAAQRPDGKSTVKNKEIAYDIVRSSRNTADIVVERDGRIIVRAPAGAFMYANSDTAGRHARQQESSRFTGSA